REHCLSLNTAEQARRFHQRLLALCVRAEMSTGEPVRIAIVGGGATGVELAAELSSAGDEIAAYGMRLRQLKRPLHITVLEASDSLLSALPQHMVSEAHENLRRR